jgi:hypothetical protein
MQDNIELFGLLLCAALVVGAVVLFVFVQIYLNSPLRRQLNDLWFAEFQRNLQQRYSEPELNWRVNAISRLFSRG